MNAALFFQCLGIVHLQNPRVFGRGLEIELGIDINPRNLINFSSDWVVQLSLKIDFARVGVSLASPHLEHAAIDGRDIDVEIAAVCSDGVISESVKFLEMLLLHNEETFSVPQRFRIVELASCFLRNAGKEMIEQLRYMGANDAFEFWRDGQMSMKLRDEAKLLQNIGLIVGSQNYTQKCLNFQQ